MKRFILLLFVLALVLPSGCDRGIDKVVKLGPYIVAHVIGWEYHAVSGIIEIAFQVSNVGDSDANSYTVEFKIIYDLGTRHRKYYGGELRVGEKKEHLHASYDIGKGHTISSVDVVNVEED